MTRRAGPPAGHRPPRARTVPAPEALELVRKGVALYNAGRRLSRQGAIERAAQGPHRSGLNPAAAQFWQAHEALETVWRQSAPPERSLWQGLIQAAAAMLHRERGNTHGLQVQGRAAIERLSIAAPANFPIETVQFVRGLAGCVNRGGPVPPMSLTSGVAGWRPPPRPT